MALTAEKAMRLEESHFRPKARSVRVMRRAPISRTRLRGNGWTAHGARLFASNPQATYGLSLLRRIASSRAFLTLSRSRAYGRPTLME
jgi:hypothetical protein